MAKVIDLTNQKFDKWTVLYRAENSIAGKARWMCRCICGIEKEVVGSDLRSGKSTNCGCDHYRKVKQFLTGRKRSKEIRDKISKNSVGKIISEETKLKISKAMVGNKNPNWKGGKTPNRLTYKYKEWRSQVLKRDNYTCQKCKQRSGMLNAHHIESFNNNPNLRTEISNGITLCKDCHDDFHHQYGRGNNTRKQLNQFMEGK